MNLSRMLIVLVCLGTWLVLDPGLTRQRTQGHHPGGHPRDPGLRGNGGQAFADPARGNPGADVAAARAGGKPFPALAGMTDRTFFWTEGTLSRLLQGQPLEPVAPPRTFRGGPGVFRALAPAVVVVRTWRGHGTGFVIDGTGLVLTNNHVVDGTTYVDPKSQSSYARIALGKLQGSGNMKRLEEEVRGYVLAVDRDRDLALLRLDPVPKAIGALTVVPMADGDPAPGLECAMVGHPASGMLWTYSEGRISALGQSPWDMVDFLLPLMHASAVERSAIESQRDSIKSLTVVLSSCLANPGDSGGPLVDAEGRLIGVTFAVPGEVSKRVLTYHIALSEVKAFLAGAKRAPTLLVPDVWQIGPMLGFAQRNVLVGEAPGSHQMLLDLDVDTPGELVENKDFRALVDGRRFDAEMAIHGFRDRRLAFYDTENDGTMDVILVDHDADDAADQRYRFQGGAWRFEDDITTPFLDPSLCGPLAEAFRSLARTLGMEK